MKIKVLFLIFASIAGGFLCSCERILGDDFSDVRISLSEEIQVSYIGSADSAVSDTVVSFSEEIAATGNKDYLINRSKLTSIELDNFEYQIKNRVDGTADSVHSATFFVEKPDGAFVVLGTEPGFRLINGMQKKINQLNEEGRMAINQSFYKDNPGKAKIKVELKMGNLPANFILAPKLDLILKTKL